MTGKIEKLINRLIELDIQIELEGENNLRIKKNISEVPADVLTDLKEQKNALIEYFLVKKVENHKQKYNTIPRTDKKDFYVLSSAQKRLYFLQSLSPGSTSYNMQYYHFFNESLDRGKLDLSLQKLMERHEILRTCFVEAQGNVVQKVHKKVTFSIDYYECEGSDDVNELVKKSIRAFDLTQAPLFRSLLIKIKDNYLWMVDIHHLLSDGTSQGILISDMISIYQGLELPALTISYKDYAEWQNKLGKNGELVKQQNYWETKLKGDLPILNLPYDFPHPSAFTFEGARYSFKIDKKRTGQLKEMGKRYKGTLQMSMMAILNVLLFKYTRQEDIIVGCGISGRSHSVLQGMVGLFVNMLAIRSQPNATGKFSSLYAEVIAASLEAYENQDIQFDDLVDVLKINRDVSRNPIFDVALVVQNFNKTEIEGEYDIVSATAHDAISADIENTTSKFDLTFIVNESDVETDVVIEYYTGIFKESTVKRIADHFNKIIDQVLTNEDILLSDIDILSEEERKRLLKEFNHTAAKYPEESSIHSLVSKQSFLNLGKTAVSDENGSYTYLEIEKHSNRLGNFLRGKLNISIESRVGILQSRNKEIVPSILGVLKAGGAYVNLDSKLPEERLLYMLKDANVKYVLTEKNLVGLASRLQWRSEIEHIICVDSEDIYSEHGGITNDLMRKDLWDYVGDSAVDAITAGGWISSYTGNPISKEEMQEYSANAYLKIKDLLHKEMKVLEIGCSSGLTMFQVAPKVGSYYGTDLSSSILQFTQKEATLNGIDNVFLTCMPADEIDTLGEKDFDLIIINSVIQCFEDQNYLRDVLKKSVSLLKEQGYIFAGDIMDEGKRINLIDDLKAFKKLNTDTQFKTKTDWSSELFVSKDYFNDLLGEDLGIVQVDFTDKIYTIENELTKFRYDTLMQVGKKVKKTGWKKLKNQSDLSAIKQCEEMVLPGIEFSGQNLCYVVYTSGSTGQPKGVLIEHHSLVNLCTWQKEYLGMSNTSVSTQCADIGFDAFAFEVFPLLISGGKLEIIPESKRVSVQHLVPFFTDKAITHTFLPTPLYHEILSAGLASLMSELVVWVGGDRLKYGSIEGIELHNCYGPSECTVCVTATKINKDQIGLPLIGKPINNSAIFILDAENKLQPLGITGEICISGAGLARGYLNQATLTQEKFIANPFKKGERLYKTGDLGRWLEDGNIEFLGRKDNQVKVRGYRIELGEIEHALLKNEQIEEAVVLANDDKEGESELVAYFSAKTEQNLSELRAFLKAILPEYMLPAYYVQLKELPLNSNGKIDKKLLSDPRGFGIRSGVEYVAPKNALEQTLVKIWKKVLQIETIGVKDDFFILGGHSLKAVRLSNEYGKELNVKLSLKDLFAHTSIESHAELIRSSKTEEFIQIEKSAIQPSYPISDAQRRLWVLSQFDEGSVPYNMPSSLYLDKDIDVDCFTRAIESTLERHEILRTVFKADEAGEIKQWILKREDLNFKIDHKDFRKEKNKEEKVKEYIGEDAYKIFDLEKGPLLRAALLLIEDQQYAFYFNMHHIIGDGWSMEVLSRDVFSYYEAYKKNQEPALKELRIQYKDYSAWQLAQLEEESFKAHKEYWLETLKGELPVLDLPTGKQRPRIKTSHGNTLSTYLNKTLSQKLKNYSHQLGGTTFMGLLASLNAILYRYTSQNDVIIGSPVAGREHADLQDQIGFYVNTLVLRNEVKAEENFEELFSRVKQQTLNAYSHQRYPFDKLVEELNLQRDTSRSAVFDVMLVLQNNKENKTDFTLRQGREDEIVDHGPGTSKFDLLISVQEQGDYLSFSVEYNTDVYEREMIMSFITHYKNLLSKLLSDPKQSLGRIDYLFQPERDKLLNTFNNTQVNYKASTVMALFEAQVTKTPDKIALEFGKETLSYNELNARSNALATILKESYKVSVGIKVGVMLERSMESVIAMIGVMKTGACYVPIDHAYPSERVKYIIEDSGSAVILSEETLSARHTIKEGVIDLKKLELEKSNKNNLKTTNQLDSDSYVIYTSGSTGQPKGVVQTHRMLSNLIQWDIHHSGISTGLKHLQYSSFSFDASLHDLYFVLSSGGSAYIVQESSRLDYEVLKEEILINAVEVLSMPFSALNAFCIETKLDKLESHRIKYIISTAEQLYVNDRLKRFLEKNPKVELHNHYGPSETHVVTSYKMSSALGNIETHAPIGNPISNSRIYILDQYQNLVPEGIEGELYIGGDNLAVGYLNKEEITRERFVKDPFKTGELLYKTGDQGFWRSDGTIVFIGRKDDQVKIRGYRIELGEIEHALQSYKGIEEAVVLAKASKNNEKELIAYITAKTEQNTLELRSYLKTMLPEYMLPAYYVQLESLPLTSNGKIDKKSLPDPQGLGLAGGITYVAPRNEIEKKLVKIWEEVLQRNPIGIHDDFFALGGHSIKAVKVISKINHEFKSGIKIGNLFSTSTIEDLSAIIDFAMSQQNIRMKIKDLKELEL